MVSLQVLDEFREKVASLLMPILDDLGFMTPGKVMIEDDAFLEMTDEDYDAVDDIHQIAEAFPYSKKPIRRQRLVEIAEKALCKCKRPELRFMSAERVVMRIEHLYVEALEPRWERTRLTLAQELEAMKRFIGPFAMGIGCCWFIFSAAYYTKVSQLKEAPKVEEERIRKQIVAQWQFQKQMEQHLKEAEAKVLKPQEPQSLFPHTSNE